MTTIVIIDEIPLGIVFLKNLKLDNLFIIGLPMNDIIAPIIK